jgi:hypothetical protein
MQILSIEGPLRQGWFCGEAESTRGHVYRWFLNIETGEELTPFRLAGEATLDGAPAECWMVAGIRRMPALTAAARAALRQVLS